MELARKRPRQLYLWLVMGLLILLMYPYMVVFASEMGGFISEKLISRSGVSSSSLVISRGNPQIDIGMAPTVTTLPAVASVDGGSKATLRGNLSNMNNFPQATVWFEWGYGQTYSNSVGSQVVTTTGEYSTPISGYDPNQPIYYRFVSEADGTNYGNGILIKPIQSSTWTIGNLLPITILVVLLIGLFNIGLKSNDIRVWGILIGLTVMAIITFMIMRNIINTAFWG